MACNGVGTYIALNSNDISEMRTVENEYQDILTIGKIFDVEDKAQQLVDKMKAEVEKVTSQAKGMEKKSVLIVELMSDTIWTYDETYLAGDMVKSMGGDLINTEREIGAENIVELGSGCPDCHWWGRTETGNYGKPSLCQLESSTE